MSCLRPKQAWENIEGGRPVFRADDPRAGRPLQLACGKCIGCQQTRKSDVGVRSMHEAQLHGINNCFLTLTYDEAHLPVGNVLVPRDFQLFMKRFRKAILPWTVRYLMCGEYGGVTGRAHFHVNLFGYFPPDAKVYPGKSKGGEPMFTSEFVRDLWGKGEVWVERGDGGVYIAGHNEIRALRLAEVDGEEWRLPGRHCLLRPDSLGRLRSLLDREGEPVVWVPEYSRASMRPGLGKAWIEKYALDTFMRGFVVGGDGKPRRLPRYYVDVAERGDLMPFSKGYVNDEMVAEFKAQRMADAEALNPDDQTPERRRVIEQCKVFEVKRRSGDMF